MATRTVPKDRHMQQLLTEELESGLSAETMDDILAAAGSPTGAVRE